MLNINRRTFLQALSAAALAPAAAFPASKQKPNIVLILADDMGQHQLGCYGNSFYETPNIDRIAARGMKFIHGYAAAPVCSPTRASLMTGKYPARLHLTDFIPGGAYPNEKLVTPEWQKFLPLDIKVLPEMLAEAGYISGHFGKWHLSKDKNYQPGRPGDPDTRGFEEVLALDKPESRQAVDAGANPDYDAHRVREITNRAISFIENHRDRPFFCYVSHSSIHQPIMEYTPRVLKYANKPESSNAMGNNPFIGAMVETLDTNVGRLLDTLDALHLSENTLVIFLGDNGDYFGREGRKPLYGAKADLYEGGVRVPFLMQWPDVIPPNTVCPVPVCSIDFYPTFAEMAGLSVNDPDMDGVSLLPVMTQNGDLPRDALYWHYPHYHSHGVAPSGSIRMGRFKLIEWFEHSIHGADAPGAFSLFDLEQDPGECVNLAEHMPGKVRELYEKLKAWRTSVGAQTMTLNASHTPENSKRK